jgi:hypothetical protein
MSSVSSATDKQIPTSDRILSKDWEHPFQTGIASNVPQERARPNFNLICLETSLLRQTAALLLIIGIQSERAMPSVAGSAPALILMPCTHANVWLSGDRTV